MSWIIKGGANTGPVADSEGYLPEDLVLARLRAKNGGRPAERRPDTVPTPVPSHLGQLGPLLSRLVQAETGRTTCLYGGMLYIGPKSDGADEESVLSQEDRNVADATSIVDRIHGVAETHRPERFSFVLDDERHGVLRALVNASLGLSDELVDDSSVLCLGEVVVHRTVILDTEKEPFEHQYLAIPSTMFSDEG